MHYLTIDQGGHGSRAALFDHRGRLTGSVLRPVGENRPGTGRVEQDPEEILGSIRSAVDSVLVAHRGNVAAAGLATQRASVICWDRLTGEPLTPVISWQDRRRQPFPGLDPEAAGEVRRKTGLILSPHYGAGKLRWCLDEHRDVRAAAREDRLACGPLASFLLFHLVRDRPFLVDPANGCRTLLWNLAAGDWDPDLLEWAGIPRDILPDPAPTLHRFGEFETGHGPIPLTVLNGDQSCVPFAIGKADRDSVYINLGTGAFLQRLMPVAGEAPDRLLRSVILDRGGQTVQVMEGTVNGAGSARAVHRCEDVPGPWLESRDPPLYLNGISGLGSPWWAPDFSSRFIGEGEAAARRDAVVESILFLIRTNLDRMVARNPPVRLVVTGGLSRSTPICRRLADLCAIPVVRPNLDEATSAGLAFLTAGMPDRWDGGPESERFLPEPDRSIARRYVRWLRAMEDGLQEQAGGVGPR